MWFLDAELCELETRYCSHIPPPALNGDTGRDNCSGHALQKRWGEVSQSVRAAITKYHTLNGLNNRNLFPHSSGGWRSEIKVLTGVLLNSCRISVYRLKFVSLNKSTWTIPV